MDREARTALLSGGIDEKFELEYEPSAKQSWLHVVAQPTFAHNLSLNLRGVPRTVVSITKRFLYALVPQLARTIIFNHPLPASKHTSTTWMNGIRGLAAFFVFNSHYFYNFTYTVVLGFASNIKDWTSNYYPHQFPGLTLTTDGPCGVMVFFTVAGYVCAYKPIRAMTNGEQDTLFKSLPASIFRRWFRLYLPTFCATLGISMLAYLGAYEPSRYLFDPAKMQHYFPGPGDEPQPKRLPTLQGQLTNWWTEMFKLYNFWTEYPTDTPFDNHLWTIPYEYRTSMHLYIVLVALALCKPWARLFLLAFIGYLYALPFVHHEATCFFGGAILAQLDVLRQNRQKQLDSASLPSEHLDSTHSQASSRRRFLTCPSWRTLTRTFFYCFALYLMSFPIRGIKYPSPLYEHIVNPLIPKRYGRGVGGRFPKQVGTLILMYLLTTVPVHTRARSFWHRLLTCNVATYLGTIMFGLYLVHGTVMHTFGYALPHVIWRYTGGNDTMARYLFGVMTGWFISLVVTLWVADVWTREVEGRCIRFTQWLEGLIFDKR